MNQKYSFGTGKLTATPEGGEPVAFGTVQDVTIDVSFSDKELRGERLFPVDVARTQGKVSIKAKFAEIDGKLFNSIFFGAEAVETVDGMTEITLGNELMGACPVFSLEFENRFQGLVQKWEFPRVTASKLSFAYKNEDYVVPDLDMTAFADGEGRVLVARFTNQAG